MAKECVITGKSSKTAGRYSNRVRATQFNPGMTRGSSRRKANLQKRRIYIPETGQYVSVVLSTRGLKTLRKNGAYAALKKANVI